MHIIEKAASLVGNVTSVARKAVAGSDEVTVQLCNGTGVELRVADRTTSAGECAVNFEALKPGEVGAVRFSGDGGFASTVIFSLEGCAERLSMRATRTRATNAEGFSLDWAEPKSSVFRPLERLSTFGSQVAGSARTQRAAGQKYAAVRSDGGDAGFDPASAGGAAGRDRVTVLIADKNELPAAADSEAKAALGRHMSLSSLSSLQLVWFAEWVQASERHRACLGHALFISEYSAVLNGLPSARPRDEAFILDLLVEAFVSTKAFGAGQAVLEPMHQRWLKERPQELPAASAAAYSDYADLPDDALPRLRAYIVASHSLLRAASLLSARALKSAVAECGQLGEEGEALADVDHRLSAPAAELNNNADIFKSHLERITRVTSKASVSSTGSAAADIPSLVKICVGESVEHSTRKRALFGVLEKTLGGPALRRYCEWIPLARRQFSVPASATQPSMRCMSFGDELFSNLDGGRVAGPEQLLASLGPKSQDFKVLSTNSKSGEFFFFSGDARFLVKTVTDHEGQILRDMLPAYQDHLRSLPSSFIVRYAGLFHVEVDGCLSKYFTVMASVFDPACKVHETYDVKGSLYNRVAKEGESIGKDKNWFDSERKLKLPVALRRERLGVHEQDCALMAKFNVMDYSLLIGVHKVAEGTGEPQGSGVRAGGGLWAEGDREIYFVGMIDFLIGFSFKKEAEHIVRTAQGHGEDASCVNPTDYAMRQVTFVREKVFSMPEDRMGTVGLIRISGVSGKNLINADGPFDKSDPYLLARLGLQTARTSTIKDDLNPVWKDEELVLPVHTHHKTMKLELGLWDAESARALRGADDFLGNVLLPMDSVLEGKPIQLSRKVEGVQHGELTATIVFERA